MKSKQSHSPYVISAHLMQESWILSCKYNTDFLDIFSQEDMNLFCENTGNITLAKGVKRLNSQNSGVQMMIFLQYIHSRPCSKRFRTTGRRNSTLSKLCFFALRDVLKVIDFSIVLHGSKIIWITIFFLNSLNNSLVYFSSVDNTSHI